MKKATDFIRRHQVVAFFAVAFVISWGLAFAWDAVLNRDQGLLLPLAFVSTCGPGLAGIIVSAVINTQPKQGPRKTFWIAFLVAWIVSALVCLANFVFFEGLSLSLPVIIVFTVSVIPVAFIVASAYSRIPAVRNHLASLLRLRGVGMGTPGPGVFPRLTPALPSRGQHHEQTTPFILSIPRNKPIADWSDRC